MVYRSLPSQVNEQREFRGKSCVSLLQWAVYPDAVVTTLQRVVDEDAWKKGYLVKNRYVTYRQAQHGQVPHIDVEMLAIAWKLGSTPKETIERTWTNQGL